jgi:Asp-tRNA(Asn)/Glu-tRNA(Gln) amidotransferase A subunit family amidase
MSDATLREAFGELLEALGPDVMTIDIEPLIAHGDAAANAVAAFELAHQLTSLRGVPPTANAGEEPSAEKYARALGARQELLAVLGGVFVDHGTILMQAAPLVAVSAAGEPAKVWTYLGLPTISVPLLECAGQPCGVMLVGASGDDGRLLRTARLLGEQIARLA